MISLDYNTNILKVKAVKDENFIKDRNILNSISAKKAVYDKEDYFQYWEIPKYFYINLLDKFEDIKYIGEGKKLLKEYEQNLIPLSRLIGSNPEFKAKNGLILTSYQKNYNNIDFNKRGLICSFDQGLGKTAASLIRAKSIGFKRLLIVAPKATLNNWASEIEEIYGEIPTTFAGNKEKRLKLRKSFKEVVVTNYEKVGEIKNLAFDSVIIDEVQNLANPAIKIYKDLNYVLRKNEPIIQGLSGTPIRLVVKDLWAVFQLVDPLLAGDRSEFVKNYETVLNNSSFEYVSDSGLRIRQKIKGRRGVKNLDKLQKIIDALIYRVKKNDYVKFERKMEIIDVEMTPAQSLFYKEIEKEVCKDVDIKNVLNKTLQLLKAAEGLHNFHENSQESGKLQYIKKEIDKGDKLVIWSRFKAITFLLKRLYKNRVVVYNGDIPDGLKKLNVWAFQGVKDNEREEFERLLKYYPDYQFSPGEAQVIVQTVNLRSGLGTNYHSADKCIFASFDTNPNSNIQARDRIERMNQKSDLVSTRFLVSRNTKEKDVLKLLLNYYEKTIEVLDGRFDSDLQLTKDLIRLLR